MNMDAQYNLPLGDLPQDNLPELPEITDCDWIPLKKALETYTRVALNHMRLWIQNTDEDELEELWDAVGDRPDKNKIPIKSPLESGLSEEKIRHVVAATQKYLGVDPPKDYLDLLRNTNGVRAAGTYDSETTSRIQMEPFSPWDDVEFNLAGLLSSEPRTKSGIPHEIARVFDLSPLSARNLDLVCGFKCGMLYNTYGDSCGLWYLLVKPEGADREAELTGKRWQLIGCPIRRSGFESFASIEAVLKEWARLYIAWGEQM